MNKKISKYLAKSADRNKIAPLGKNGVVIVKNFLLKMLEMIYKTVVYTWVLQELKVRT